MITWELNGVTLGAGAAAPNGFDASCVVGVTGTADIHAYGALSSDTAAAVSSALALSNKVWLAIAEVFDVVSTASIGARAFMPFAAGYAADVVGTAAISVLRAFDAVAEIMAVATTSSISAKQAVASAVAFGVTGSTAISVSTYLDASEERTMRLSDDGRVMTIPGDR